MIPQTIVVPLDGSPLAERAVRVAAPLAERIRAGIILTSTTHGDSRARRSYLDYVAALAGEGDFDVAVSEDLDAAEAIARTVAAQPAAMLCMTTHGAGRLRWAVAGSVAEQLIRESDQPLLLVGPRGEPRWNAAARRLVVCVDGSPAAVAAVRHACEWAKVLGLEITIVFVTHPLDVEGTAHPETIFEELEKVVRDEGIPVHATQLFRSAFIAGALADFAEDSDATLLVMAAGRHGRVARVALGSTTMGVLNSAACPVLVVPPGDA